MSFARMIEDAKEAYRASSSTKAAPTLDGAAWGVDSTPIIFTEEPAPTKEAAPAAPTLSLVDKYAKAAPPSYVSVFNSDYTSKLSPPVSSSSTGQPQIGIISDKWNMVETGSNTTVLDNPAEESLFTIKWGDGLLANYAGTSSQANLSDDYAGAALAANTEPQTTDSGQTVGGAIVGGVLDAAGVGNPLMIFEDTPKGRKVRHETFLFIAGAIILALGIYALVR